jgi:hypothetical protein
MIAMARQQGRFQLASDIIPMPLWMGPCASSMALQLQRVAAHLQGRKSTVSGKAHEELHLHMTALLRGCGPACRKQSKHLGSHVLLASGIEDIRFCAECKHWVGKKLHKSRLQYSDDLGPSHVTSPGRCPQQKERLELDLCDHIGRLSTGDIGIENPYGNTSPLAKRMQALWRSRQFCDMILVSGQSRVLCHRCVIGVSSLPLFEALEAADKEGQADAGNPCVIVLEEIYSKQALLIVVAYMYGEVTCTRLRDVELRCLVDVFQLATMLELLHLARLSAEALPRFLPDLDIASLKRILRKMHEVATIPRYIRFGWVWPPIARPIGR